ncbi:MAG: OmpA family protein [Gammaproteobacteria bacterium]
MAINLIDLFIKGVGSDLATRAAHMLGESPEATHTAVANAFPAILGGLLSKASTSGGADEVFRIVTDSKVDDSVLDNPGDFLGGGEKTDNLVSLGSNLLPALFGQRAGGLGDALSSVAGISQSSAGKLLAMIVPVALGFLKRHAREKNMGASGMADLLAAQKDYLRAGLDSRVTNAMGFGDVTSFLSGVGGKAGAAAQSASAGVERTASAAAAQVEKSGSGMFRWIAIIAAVLIGLFLLRTCGDDAERVASEAAREASEAARNVGEAASEVAREAGETARDVGAAASQMASDTAEAVKETFRTIELPGGMAVNVVPDGFVEEVVNYLQDGSGEGRFAFDALEFETDSARIAATSNRQLDAVAMVLNAYPAASVLVEGHTDNTGDADTNARLSTDRAQAVKQALVDRGVEAGRIVAVGSGSSQPIASNDTPEGRAANRRVELVVTRP